MRSPAACLLAGRKDSRRERHIGAGAAAESGAGIERRWGADALVNRRFTGSERRRFEAFCLRRRVLAQPRVPQRRGLLALAQYAQQEMTRRTLGPRRSDSLRTYVHSTRIIGGISVLALSGAVAWDLANDGFWFRHTLFTALVASLIVVALTVAVLNELLERRQRERWSVVAQYALFDLVRTARLVWSGLLELAGLLPEGELGDGALAAGTEAVLDTPNLAAAIDEMLATADPPRTAPPANRRPARSQPGGTRALGRCDGQLGHLRRDPRSPRRALQSPVLVGERPRRVGSARGTPESAEAEPSRPVDPDKRASRGRVAARQSRSYRAARRVARGHQ